MSLKRVGKSSFAAGYAVALITPLFGRDKELRGKNMQRIRQLYAVDEQRQVHAVAVYKHDLGFLVYRLDDQETVERVEERWFLTQAGDVLAASDA